MIMQRLMMTAIGRVMRVMKTVKRAILTIDRMREGTKERGDGDGPNTSGLGDAVGTLGSTCRRCADKDDGRNGDNSGEDDIGDSACRIPREISKGHGINTRERPQDHGNAPL